MDSLRSETASKARKMSQHAYDVCRQNKIEAEEQDLKQNLMSFYQRKKIECKLKRVLKAKHEQQTALRSKNNSKNIIS